MREPLLVVDGESFIMYNPEEIFTKDGLEEHKVHLFNMRKAIFWLLNHADDLHIGAYSDNQLDVIFELKKMLPTFETGDGEKYEGI